MTTICIRKDQLLADFPQLVGVLVLAEKGTLLVAIRPGI